MLSHGASTSISAKKQAFLLERSPSDDTGPLGVSYSWEMIDFRSISGNVLWGYSSARD